MKHQYWRLLRHPELDTDWLDGDVGGTISGTDFGSLEKTRSWTASDPITSASRVKHNISFSQSCTLTPSTQRHPSTERQSLAGTFQSSGELSSQVSCATFWQAHAHLGLCARMSALLFLFRGTSFPLHLMCLADEEQDASRTSFCSTTTASSTPLVYVQTGEMWTRVCRCCLWFYRNAHEQWLTYTHINVKHPCTRNILLPTRENNL